MAIPARLRLWKVYLSATAALFAAACAETPASFRSPCTSGVCKAWVTVVDCAQGHLPVNPDPIRVPGTNNIEWTIDTDGYKFPANGIVVSDPGFTGGHVTGNGKKFILNDAARVGYYKYTVTVVRESDGVTCKPYDPFIHNS